MKKLIAIAAILTSATFAVNAQTVSSTASQTVNLALNNAIEITFTGSGTAIGGAVTMTFNNVNDYANGVTSQAQELKVRSNKAFGVTVNANAANFTYVGTTTPAPTMPVSGILGLKVTANGTGGTVASPFSTTAYSGITNAAQGLISNGTNGGAQTFSVMYQATPGFSYPAGNYAVNVVYTATQN